MGPLSAARRLGFCRTAERDLDGAALGRPPFVVSRTAERDLDGAALGRPPFVVSRTAERDLDGEGQYPEPELEVVVVDAAGAAALPTVTTCQVPPKLESPSPFTSPAAASPENV